LIARDARRSATRDRPVARRRGLLRRRTLLQVAGSFVPGRAAGEGLMPEVEVVVKDGKAQLVSREGQLIAVPVEQAGRLIAEGARPADEAQVEKFGRDQKYSTIGQKAITAVEGAAEGATLGLSTAAAVELGGEDYREAARARAEANPI